MKLGKGLMVPFIATLAGLCGLAYGSEFQVTVGISQNTGQVGFGFDPNRIVPVAGDTVIFSFSIPSYINDATTGAYSATQGAFATPCQPLSGGFDTGLQKTAPENGGSAPQFTLQINDTQPLYFYSSVGNQCQSGMVLGVNTPASGDGSIDAYAAAASSAPASSGASSAAASGRASASVSSAPTSSSAASSSGSATASSGAPSASSSQKSDASAQALVAKEVAGAALISALVACSLIA